MGAHKHAFETAFFAVGTLWLCACARKRQVFQIAANSVRAAPDEHAERGTASKEDPTFACDKHHMLRTVGEKTLAEKMCDEQ